MLAAIADNFVYVSLSVSPVDKNNICLAGIFDVIFSCDLNSLAIEQTGIVYQPLELGSHVIISKNNDPFLPQTVSEPNQYGYQASNCCVYRIKDNN